MKPWMPQNQIDLIQSYLSINKIMLEYGCGGSTLYFSKYVKKYISIEHDVKWIQNIQLSNNITDNIQIHYCPPNNKIKLPVWRGKEKDFQNYINYIDLLPYKHYDYVLLDGRCRQFCAKKIINYIDKKSIIFFHDFFERHRYHNVLQNYQIIDFDIGNKQTLAILQKK